MFNDCKIKEKPSANTYKINESLVTLNKSKDRFMGYGRKMDLAKPLNNNPGPSDYTPLNGSFDSNY